MEGIRRVAWPSPAVLVAIVTLQFRRRFSGRAILLWALLYAAFVAYVVATG